MKTKKMLVRLFPDTGRIINGAFGFINGNIVICDNITPTSVTVNLNGEYVEFPLNAIKLAKYYGFTLNGKKLIGEIMFREYERVADKDIIIGEIFNKPSPIEIGDKVKIHKPNLSEYTKCEKNDFEGVVIKCSSRVFKIALVDCVVELKRNQFKTINKPNSRNIIHIINKINT